MCQEFSFCLGACASPYGCDRSHICITFNSLLVKHVAVLAISSMFMEFYVLLVTKGGNETSSGLRPACSQSAALIPHLLRITKSLQPT